MSAKVTRMVAQPSDIPAPNIEELFRPTHDERSRQGMVSFIRKLAIIDMRRSLKDDYENRIEPQLDREGRKPADWQAIEKAMAHEHVYRFYSAVRYNAQEMCYLSVQPAVERALPAMVGLARDLAVRNPAGGSLRLNPKLELPKYITALDVHLTPGWVHSEHTADDVAQGAVVSFGGKVFTGQHPYRKRAGVVGESIAYWIRKKYPNFAPRRILDLGTTSGKNLLPYCTAFRAEDPVALCTAAGFDASRSFKMHIPDIASFGEERYERFMRGDLPSPAHGAGGWFVFGAERE